MNINFELIEYEYFKWDVDFKMRKKCNKSLIFWMIITCLRRVPCFSAFKISNWFLRYKKCKLKFFF